MYNPTTDFLALVRNAGGAASVAEMPGLDYVLAALARMNFVQLWTGQTAPTANQATTAWLKTALPSWTAEGVVFLWNSVTAEYEPATPALWQALLSFGFTYVSGYSFQSVAGAAGVIVPTKSLVAIQRATPAATALALPAVIAQLGKPLQIADWSTAVVSHVITLTPSGAETIMQRPSWALLSTPDQPAGITLYPSPDLNGWAIAP